MQANELIRVADLAGARQALTEAVKSAPANVERRFELGELLLVQGDFERADNHFDLVSTQDTSWALSTSLIRQLIRAEADRRDVLENGATPEVTGDATEAVAAALRILLELREGRDAGEMRAEADEAAPVVRGQVNGQTFEGVRDLDDRVADVLEVLTSTGKYYWIPWTQISALKIDPPQRLRDLIWRKAELDVKEGPSGVVYIPATYLAAAGEATDTQRLARETDWVEQQGLTRGLGQRCFLVGDEIMSLSEIETLVIEA
jgi:type VI secretion system protein ImpE